MTRWRGFGLLAVAMVLAGAPTAPAASEGPGAEAPDLFSQADELLQEVSEILHLPVLRSVRKQRTTREEVKAYLLRQIDRQYPDGALDDLGRALELLDLLPRGYDLKAGLVGLLTDQVAGYYDPEKKIFFLADWVPPVLQRPALAHELTHVLQDQHFDLSPILRPSRGDQDADQAFLAVVEGQGTAVMMEILIRPLGISLETSGSAPGAMGELSKVLSAPDALGLDTTTLHETPRFLVETLMFPYIQGFAFCLAYLETGTWKGLRRLLEERPASTEEILHPEKYLQGRDLPEPVEAPELEKALPPGWRVFFRDRLGEFTLGQVLAVHLEASEALEAAEGWDGDRTLLAEGPGGEGAVLLQRSRWDSPRDAIEYFRAWVRLVEARHPDAQPIRFTKDRLATWKTEEGDVRLWAREDLVGLVEGAPGGMMARLFPEPVDDVSEASP